MKQILLISLLSLTYADKDIVCPSNTEGMSYDVWCIRNQIKESNTCNDDIIKITWDYGDKDKGEIHFTILGRMCSVMDYKLTLFRHNNSNVGVYSHTVKEVMLNRRQDYANNLTKMHSYRIIKEENPYTWSSNTTILPSCDQIRNVTFTHIYKGCYIITVRNLTVSLSYFSDPLCVTTNFMQESMFQQNITVFSQYLEDLTQVKHVVSNFNRLQVKKMDLEVWRSDSKITHCNNASDAVTKQTIVLKSSGIACGSRANVMPCKLVSEIKNSRIECFTHNVTDGYYCLLVMLGHDPCTDQVGTVWNEGIVQCIFSGVIESGIIVKKKAGQLPVSSGDMRAMIIMVFMILLFSAIIIALIYFLYRKWRRLIKRTEENKKTRSPVTVEMDIKSMPVHPQIYLMYSRDCQPFMDVMKIFRSLLKEALKCEVYDCFDPDCFEEMARLGMNWPGKFIANDNIRIVLVETRCAKLHLEAHIEDFKLAYQDPTAWDDYFMYGLKAVMHNPKYNSYHKLFIARVHGFTSEEDKLKEITPYTRYDIPDALYDLLSSILQQFNMKVPDDWNHNIHELQEAIKNLENYENSNKNYLDNFLFRREVHGFRKLISRFKHN